MVVGVEEAIRCAVVAQGRRSAAIAGLDAAFAGSPLEIVVGAAEHAR